MRFIDLHVDGFGKMVNKDVSFDDRINVVYGRNEAGKSTLHAFIRAMLFGIRRAKGAAAQTDTWSHYKPWKTKSYGGTLRLEDGGHIYRITRDFYESPMDVKVTDETSAEVVGNPDEWLRSRLCGMTVKSYDNTISIGQLKSATDSSMAEEIKSIIVNANTTGSSSLNCEKAKEFLNAQKADLAAQIVPEATRKYAINTSEIKKLEKDINGSSYGSDINSYEQELESLEQEIEENSREMSALNEAIIQEKQILADNSFTSSDDVTKSKERFRQACDDYHRTAENSNVSRFRLTWIILLILALLCGAVAVYTVIFKADNAITGLIGIGSGKLLFAAAIAYLVFLMLAILYYLKCADEKHKLEAGKEILSSMLRSYGVSDDLSEAGIEQVNEYLDHLSSVAVAVEEKETELGKIRDEQELISDRKTETRCSLDESRHDREMLYGKVRRLRELRMENDGLKDTINANERINADMDAIDIALSTIDDIARDYQDSVGVYLNGEVSKYIAQITKGAYDSVSISDDMEVYLNTEDDLVPIESVSSGTSDQIYLALRLASAKVLQNNEYKLPLIFDDSFVNYDSERLAAALEWIAQAFENQVLIFTCHRREEKILDNRNIEFKKIEL